MITMITRRRIVYPPERVLKRISFESLEISTTSLSVKSSLYGAEWGDGPR